MLTHIQATSPVHFFIKAIWIFALLCIPHGHAFAEAATAISPVNVRAGPGTGNRVLDILTEGEAVNITECQRGWCFVEHNGPNGWVSGNFLNRDPNAILAEEADAASSGNFNFEIGTGPAPNENQAQVCFFGGENYTGPSACFAAGAQDPELTGFWARRISSIRMVGEAKVKLCNQAFFEGYCHTFGTNVPFLSEELSAQIISYASEQTFVPRALSTPAASSFQELPEKPASNSN